MRLELSDATVVDALIAEVRGLGCFTERVDENAVEIVVPQSGEPWHPPRQAQIELAFLVRAWLDRYPGVHFQLLDGDAPPVTS